MAKVIIAAIILLLGIFASTADAGRSYKFRVTCPSNSKVVEWGIGAIDPGREYLRANTGVKNPGCSVSNYDHAKDKGLPVERYSNWGGVLHGGTILGLIGGAAGMIGGLF